MRTLQVAAPGDRMSVLCFGAHSDDIEIGAGASLLSMMSPGLRLDVFWCVLSGAEKREHEARNSAAEVLIRPSEATDWTWNMAMLWTLNLSDGRRSLFDIVERASLSFDVIASVAAQLGERGLLGTFSNPAEAAGD